MGPKSYWSCFARPQSIMSTRNTSLGTSVSNSDFDFGYTGLKVEDFSLLEGVTLVNFLLMSFCNLRCNYTSLISLLRTLVLKILVRLWFLWFLCQWPCENKVNHFVTTVMFFFNWWGPVWTKINTQYLPNLMIIVKQWSKTTKSWSHLNIWFAA